MSIFNKIFNSSIAEIATNVGNAIDKTTSNDGEKMSLKNETVDLVTKKMNSLLEMKKEAVELETKGSWLQKNWRPITMLCMVGIIIKTAFTGDLSAVPDQYWSLLKIGLGGYVFGRSAEKIMENVTKNIDLPFLKKNKRNL